MHEYAKKNKNATITPVVLTCEPDGRFSAMQVDFNAGFAWCVDQDTGLEIYGTRQISTKPISCIGNESKNFPVGKIAKKTV